MVEVLQVNGEVFSLIVFHQYQYPIEISKYTKRFSQLASHK